MPASLRPVFSRLRNVLDRMIGREIALKGGLATAGVVRVGDTVRRPVTERSPFVHDVLRHLELRQFDRAPRFLGIDEKGRAILGYVSGTVPHESSGFQQEQWVAGAKLLRLLHDATVDCELKGECEVICHGDPSPQNFVFRDGMPFGLIDFDLAHPGKRQEDVGYAAWRWLRIGYDQLSPQEQGARLVDFVAAYDAATTWNPLDLVLQAQYELVARLPKGTRPAKWAFVKTWAQACIDWTERSREGIVAGMTMRSDDSPG